MDSTSTLSPPTSWASEARSLVAVMIWILPAARAGGGPARAERNAKAANTAAARVLRLGACILSPTNRAHGPRPAARKRIRTGARRAHPSRTETEIEVHSRLKNLRGLPARDARSGTGRGFD